MSAGPVFVLQGGGLGGELPQRWKPCITLPEEVLAGILFLKLTAMAYESLEMSNAVQRSRALGPNRFSLKPGSITAPWLCDLGQVT